jgi:hypothetical protein
MGMTSLRLGRLAQALEFDGGWESSTDGRRALLVRLPPVVLLPARLATAEQGGRRRAFQRAARARMSRAWPIPATS